MSRQNSNIYNFITFLLAQLKSSSSGLVALKKISDNISLDRFSTRCDASGKDFDTLLEKVKVGTFKEQYVKIHVWHFTIYNNNI